MLRYVVGDSLFFEILNSYAADPGLKYEIVTTADFNEKVNSVTSEDYDWFFDQWVYSPNHPVYQNSYSISGSGPTWQIDLIVNQIQQNTVLFKMPVDIKIEFIDATDTTVTVITNAVASQTYNFQLDKEPAELIFDPDRDIVLKVVNTVLVSVDVNENIPADFSLEQNYPNPFNPTTTIKYSLPEKEFVTLKIFDVMGNEVNTVVNEEKLAGTYSVEYSASGLASGIYFYQFTTAKYTDTKKFVILK